MRPSFDAVDDWVHGRRWVVRGRSRTFAKRRLVQGVLRSVAWPSGPEVTGGRTVSAAARPLLEALFPDRPAEHWDGIDAELAALAAEVERRYADGRWLLRPAHWCAGRATCELIYGIVRTRSPETVLETGAANGHLSVYVISALRRNGRGHLHSTDLDTRAGPLVEPEERSWWTLHVVDWKRMPRSWAAILATLPPLDLFFHDSDHAYTWQKREYEDALRHLAPGGILASDDVQATYAFLDVCGAHGLKPVILAEEWKMAAAALTPTAAGRRDSAAG